MIEHVKTKGFKGFDIDEDIYPKTLFCGKNKSGKSTRAAAIALTLLGYIPFAARTGKKNADILNDFGQGKTLTTAVVCNGVEFERHYALSGKGGVSQRLRVNKKKYSAAEFAVELSRAGAPKIIDVGAFTGLSDQKKIDTLFELFPPESDLKNLDDQIEKAKKRVNDLNVKERSAVAVIQRLTSSKSEIKLPAGTLAEVQAEIAKLTKQVRDAQDSLKIAEIEAAESAAAEKARAEQKKASQKEFDKIMADGGPTPEPLKKDFVATTPGNQRIYDFVTGKPGPFDLDPVKSIQKILDVLNTSGCEVCAAAIVARQELKRFKKGVAA